MDRRSCVIVLSVLALGLAVAGRPTLAQNLKIGVFDVQKVTAETAEGAKIQARLNAFKEKKTAELKKLQEDIERLQQEFVQTSTSLSDDKKKEMALRIQRRQDELDSANKAANRELQLEVEAAQDGWQRRVIEVVNNYGKANGYSLILPSDAVLYMSPDIDITPELVKAIDVPPAAAPAPAPASAPPAPAAPKK